MRHVCTSLNYKHIEEIKKFFQANFMEYSLQDLDMLKINITKIL